MRVKARVLFAAAVLTATLFFGVLLGIVAGRWHRARPMPLAASSATILRQVQTLSQLVTVKYVLEKVIIVEDVKWFGENRVLLLAHGVVKAGIDLSELKPDDVKISGTQITLRLPQERITDAYLDDKRTEIIEHSTGVLRAFDKDLEQNARRQAVDDLRRAARNEGILKDAKERAQLQIEVLLRQSGFEDVSFVE